MYFAFTRQLRLLRVHWGVTWYGQLFRIIPAVETAPNTQPPLTRSYGDGSATA